MFVKIVSQNFMFRIFVIYINRFEINTPFEVPEMRNLVFKIF